MRFKSCLAMLSVVLWCGVLVAGDDLDGREVVVRVYKDWRKDAESFEKVSLKTTGKIVAFELDDVNENTVVVVSAADQNDATVKEYMGEEVFAAFYRPGLNHELRRVCSDEGETKWWFFKDALGNPMPGAVVEVYIEAASESEERVLLERMVFDETSRIAALRALPIAFQRFTVIVAHEDYGIARVRVYCAVDCKSRTIWVPMVKESIRADGRCLWGQVVDDSNNSVAGAVVRVYNKVTLPGGGAAKFVQYQDFAAITDDFGRFWLYPPIDKGEEKVKGLIPAGSKFYVRVKPPEGLRLLGFGGRISTGSEVRIELERGGYFRTFSFEDANGPVKDWGIDVCVKRVGKEALCFDYEDIKNGAWLPLGQFSARTTNHSEDVFFRPIEVTQDSPERLVFKAVGKIIYRGRVLDGSTGTSLAGAFVIVEKGQTQLASFAMLSESEWDELQQLPAAPRLDEAALEHVRKVRDFNKVVRTNEAGYFEMRDVPSGSGILVFEEDYLAVSNWSGLGKDGVIEVPTIQLFPAGAVVFESGSDMGPDIWFKWIIGSGIHQPVWADGLNRPCEESCLLMDKELHLGRVGVHRCYVPADVSLQIRLRGRLRGVVPSFTYPANKVITIEQGQTLNLGRIRFAEKVKVFVKVLDFANTGVEGIGVSIWADGKVKEVPHFTDLNGIAEFSVDPNSAGEFVVKYDRSDSNEPSLREVLPYSLEGIEDANSVYTLWLSDEMVEAVIGER